MKPQLRPPPTPKTIRNVCLLLGLLVFVGSVKIYQVQPQLLVDMEGRLLDIMPLMLTMAV